MLDSIKFWGLFWSWVIILGISETTYAQAFRKYTTEGNNVDIQLIMNKNKSFSLYLLVPPEHENNLTKSTDTIDYSGQWAENGSDYILTFVKNKPSFEVLFHPDYTPEGAIKVLNSKSFAFSRQKPYVLIWGEICMQE